LLISGSTKYATTHLGGKYGFGTIVALGASGLNGTDVYDFTGGADGANPQAALIGDSTGAIYGTTVSGGSSGQGTVFKFVPSPGGGTEQVIWSFQSQTQSDGANPYGSLVLDGSGDIIGTTVMGGTSGFGTIFKLTPVSGSYAEAILYSFGTAGYYDGRFPLAGLTALGSNFYGTTSNGGDNQCGTVYEISGSGSGYLTLHDFVGSDGQDPAEGNLLAYGAALYGTTPLGGARGYGVLYKLLP